jgi:hypothetical protein
MNKYIGENSRDWKTLTRLTLDVTLLPDFSQVQSDNKVKNLSAFETVYSEQRPFFTEAVDLFAKGSLFYSRRIGKTPTGFYSIENQIDSTETLIDNPSRSRLVNAVKLSGRNKKGLAIGVFNAITADTRATIRKADGDARHVITEPGANYNILVLDQALKNNSSVYITNASFLRDKGDYSSNVTAAGLSLTNKNNNYRIAASGGYSQFYYQQKDTSYASLNDPGFKYSVSAAKINGKFQYSINHFLMDNHYDANDLGVTLYNNYFSNSILASYIRANPMGIFKNYKLSLSYENSFHYQSKDLTGMYMTAKVNTTLMNYLSIWTTLSYDLISERDYYEPRTPGRYYLVPQKVIGYLGFSSDYRKPFALDGTITAISYSKNFGKSLAITLSPIIRLTDHFSFSISSSAERNSNDVGFATYSTIDGSSVFGKRDINTYTQVFTGRYVFINDLSLSIRARHYWSKGVYQQYYSLMDIGELESISGDFASDYYFSSFNVDLVFSWQFSPGSQFTVVWKNEIYHEGGVYPQDYFYGFSDSFRYPARNMLSVKLLYYLDYLSLRKGH